MANDGKKWEGIVRGALTNPETSVDRLPDPMMGYKGVRNICDFTVFRAPYLVYLECKATKGNTLSFSAITENQWEGLLEKSKIPFCLGLVFIWFTEHDKVVLCDTRELKDMKEDGSKSVNINQVVSKSYRNIQEVASKTPRANPKIDVQNFWEVVNAFYIRGIL